MAHALAGAINTVRANGRRGIGGRWLDGKLGTEPYLAANVGSGTVQEMSQWIEYVTFDGKSPMADLRKSNGRAEPWHLKYFGVGNENWGCGWRMRPEYYADLYRRQTIEAELERAFA